MNELEILRTRHSHPHRPPDWRWKLAGHISTHPGFLGPENDDPGVQAAMMIQAAYKDHQSSRELAEALRSGGSYTRAYDFWHTAKSSEGDYLVKIGTEEGTFEFKPLIPKTISLAEFEGMILTGAGDLEIAEWSGGDPGMVSAYEQLFFDVRSRLRNVNWIASEVIGPMYQGSPLTMIPALIRAYGWQTKSLKLTKQVADTFESDLMGKLAISADDDPTRYFEADRRGASALKGALATRMRPFNRYTYDKILETQNDTLELDAKLKLSAGAQSEQELREAAEMIRQAISHGYGQEPTNFANERMLGAPRLLVVGDNNG